MIDAASPFEMIAVKATEITAQRFSETEAAIAEQRRYLETLSDPMLKSIATRTLATLEDMLLIMRRTERLLVETRGIGPNSDEA